MPKNKIRFELRLTTSEWNSLFFIPKKRDIDKISNDDDIKEFKEDLIKRNEAIDEYISFKKRLREDKTLFKNMVQEFPSNTRIYNEIIDQFNDEKHIHLLECLFTRSEKHFYYHIISCIKNPHSLFTEVRKHMEFDIAKNIILTATPFVVQDLFEYLSEKMIATKTEEDKLQAHQEIHKMFRQADPLGCGHADSVMWSLMQISEEPLNLIGNVILSAYTKKVKK